MNPPPVKDEEFLNPLGCLLMVMGLVLLVLLGAAAFWAVQELLCRC